MRPPRRSKTQSGSALVEFALSCSVLLPLFAGTFQVGYALYNYNKLETAVRDGARYASLISYASRTSTPPSSYSTAVKNMVVYGSSTGGTTPVVPNLTTSNVTLAVTMNNDVPNFVSVAVNNYPIFSIFRTVLLRGKPKVSFKYVGRFAP